MSPRQRRADEIVDRKVTAVRDGEVVVFHVGLRINALWKIHRWLPILLVAPRMVRELVADPESGLLGSRTVMGPGVRHVGFVQYWDSFDALREYARDGDRLHLPAWRDYYRNRTGDDAAVGLWHETYLVRAGEYETVYTDVPPHGLGAADGTALESATRRRHTAAGRLGRTDGRDSPVGASDGRRPAPSDS